MGDNVKIPAQGTGDTAPPVAVTKDVNGDNIQTVQLAQVAHGGAQTLNPTLPISATSLPLPSGAATEAGNLSTIAGKDFATQTTLALIKAKTDNLDVALSTRTKPADTQPVSVVSLPLPSGASTEATLALIKAKTDNLDVALSTRTKPADAQHAIIDSGTVSIVGPVGAANIATGQVASSGTAGTLVAARATRRSVTLKNTDTSITVYVGPATVSAANGMPLKAGESISIDWTGLIQVIAASGTPTVAYMEVYD